MVRLLIIYTGCTIGMVQDQDGQLVPFDFDNIKNNVPELNRLDYHLDVYSFNPLIDSSNMSPKDWKQIALTGSQLPIGEIRTDAKENLITALEIAASRNSDNTPTVPEVCIYFDYHLFRGCRATKVHADKFDAFKSPNYPVLAEAGVDIKFNKDAIKSIPANELIVHTEFSKRCASLKLFPGISEKYVQAILNTPDIEAILFEGFGVGNTSTETWFINALEDASKRGIIILDISQCGGGTVKLGRYETSKHLTDIGVISGHDITFGGAITKMMYLLGNTTDKNEVKIMLSKNLRGEISI